MSVITVTLTFKDNTTLSLDGSAIRDFVKLVELDHQADSLNGAISANTFTMTLKNQDDAFTATNATSPYVGKMVAGVKAVIKQDGVIRGTFYVSDWASPSTGFEKKAVVKCVDRLQNVLNTPVSVVGVNKDILLKDYLKAVFNKVGFADLDILIDASLTQTVNYTVSNGDKLSSILNNVALSYDCYIYMNELDQVVVQPKAISGAVVNTLRDNVNVLTVEPVKSVLTSSNALVLGYSSPAVSEVVEVLSIPQYNVATGVSQIPNYKVEKGNLYSIAYVHVDSPENAEATNWTCTQSTVTLDMNNPAAGVSKCDIKVFGSTITTSSTYVERTDAASITAYGRKEMKLESKLTQNKVDADALADKLWTRVGKDVPFVKVSAVDNGFKYKLSEICNSISTVMNLNHTGYIHTIRSEWLGGDVIKVELTIKTI